MTRQSAEQNNYMVGWARRHQGLYLKPIEVQYQKIPQQNTSCRCIRLFQSLIYLIICWPAQAHAVKSLVSSIHQWRTLHVLSKTVF